MGRHVGVEVLESKINRVLAPEWGGRTHRLIRKHFLTVEDLVILSMILDSWLKRAGDRAGDAVWPSRDVFGKYREPRKRQKESRRKAA